MFIKPKNLRMSKFVKILSHSISLKKKFFIVVENFLSTLYFYLSDLQDMFEVKLKATQNGLI